MFLFLAECCSERRPAKRLISMAKGTEFSRIGREWEMTLEAVNWSGLRQLDHDKSLESFRTRYRDSRRLTVVRDYENSMKGRSKDMYTPEI